MDSTHSSYVSTSPVLPSSIISAHLMWNQSVMEEPWGTTLCCPRTSALLSWWASLFSSMQALRTKLNPPCTTETMPLNYTADKTTLSQTLSADYYDCKASLSLTFVSLSALWDVHTVCSNRKLSVDCGLQGTEWCRLKWYMIICG